MQQPHIGRRESGHIDSESGGPARTQRDEREEQEYVRASLDKNLHGLEYGELHGSVLLAKFGKKYCRDAVEGKYSTHIHHAAPVAVIAQKMRQRFCEHDHQCEEPETHAAHHSQRTRIDPIRLRPLLVCETEASGLQSHRKDDLKHGDIGHELRHHAIVGCGEQSRVERDKEEVDYAGEDCAQPIDGSLAGKLFQRILCHYDIYL